MEDAPERKPHLSHKQASPSSPLSNTLREKT
jgi:hypothetical protein